MNRSQGYGSLLVAALVCATGFALPGCGSGATRASAGGHLAPVTQPAATSGRAGGLAIPPGPGALVAWVQRPTTMRATPGGRPIATVRVHTEFGSPQALLVARRVGLWLGVVSQFAGNNRLGWIPSSTARFSRVTFRIDVSLRTRRLTVLDAGHVLQRYTVAIGAPAAPTPTGRFAVTDRLETSDPTGPYGCCIIALTALTPHVIQGWSGGDRIAIHSTPERSTIGLRVSHGCLRLTLAEGRWLMYHIPLGTPTVITG